MQRFEIFIWKVIIEVGLTLIQLETERYLLSICFFTILHNFDQFLYSQIYVD